jgi:hypothetical protein
MEKVILLDIFNFFWRLYVNINKLDLILLYNNIIHLIGIALVADDSTTGNILILFFYLRITNFKGIWALALNFWTLSTESKMAGTVYPPSKLQRGHDLIIGLEIRCDALNVIIIF